MYRKKPAQTTLFGNAASFTGAQLDIENRWVKMASLIPWDAIEEKYARNFKETKFSRPAKPARMAVGSLIIKEKFNLSDEETVQLIRENPYLQYFIGLTIFTNIAPFDQSTMTWFRKYVTPEMLTEVNDIVIRGEQTKENSNDENKEPPTSSGGDYDEASIETSIEASAKAKTQENDKPKNEGTLILDATCVPSDIRYPTDISLLNEGRECLEAMVDQLHKRSESINKKPRLYRQCARKEYLRFIRCRKPTRKLIRNVIRKQLGYVKRNLETIKRYDWILLTKRENEELEVIQKLYEQQKQMYNTKTHKVDSRIVSLSQSWVRPIVRGKATADVEFGAKVAISLVDGYARVERLDWNAYNESTTLKETVDRFYETTGHYPERILADKIYRTRDNLQYCATNGIHMNGPKLGRPSKDKELYRKQCLLERKESGERNEVEGEFGTGKRRYGLDRLTARLQTSCETQIHMIFLTMNLFKRLKAFLHYFSRTEFWLHFMRFFSFLRCLFKLDLLFS